MVEKVAVMVMTIAAALTAIKQIFIVITAKQLCLQQQQLQRQLEMLKAGLSKKVEYQNEMMNGITTMERWFIDQDDHLVTVSFQLLCHYWQKIEKSDKWRRVEEKILESQNRYNQTIHRD